MSALCLALAATAIGQAVLFVMVPVIGETTGIGFAGLSLVISAGILAFVVTAPVWGKLSDQLGRRGVMLWGCSGVILGQGGFAVVIEMAAQGLLAPKITLIAMIVFRLIHGCAAAALFPIAQAWVADAYGESERLSKFGSLRLAMTFGRLAGPPLAAVLTLLAPLAPVHALVAFAVLALLAMSACREPERRQKSDAPAPARSALPVFPLLLCVVVLLGVMNGQLQFSIGLHAQTRLGLTALQASQFVGVLLTIAAIAALLVQLFVIRRLNDRALAALLVSAVMASAAVALVYWSGSWWHFGLAAVFVGVSLAIAFPACAAILASLEDPQRLGRSMGAFGSAQPVGYALGAALGGLYDTAPAVSFGVAFIAPLLAVLLIFTAPTLRNHAAQSARGHQGV